MKTILRQCFAMLMMLLLPQFIYAQVFHPKGTKLQSLCVISTANLPNSAEKILVSTLQGLVAKTSSEQIFIDEGGPTATWLSHLQANYGITVTTYTSWTLLLTHFKSKVCGYILYDKAAFNKSVTAATSLCGPQNAIAVDASIESTVRSLGITTIKVNAKGKDEKWVYDNYKTLFNKQMVADLNPDINSHLRDYITLTNSFTFYDGNTEWRKNVLQELNSESFCFGYGSGDEWTFVAQAANQGVAMLPSDLVHNLAPLSSIYEEKLSQKTFSEPVTENNVHYVTFVVSDGDNVAFDLWSLKNYFSNSSRGTFSMGYTISPSLIDLAPSVLNWYYDKASNTANKDFFVAGPSGSGYTYPSQMPSDKLDIYLERLNTFMDKSGLNISNILDNKALWKMDLWNKFLSKPTIDALIYSGYGEDPGGRIYFADNGKPVIEQRDILWSGLEEEPELISNINSRPTDPSSPASYTLVYVHAWTKTLSNIKTVVNGLNPNVRVVTPDVFVKLVTRNLKGKVDKASSPYNDGSPVSLSGAQATIQAEDFDKGGEGAGYHDTNSTPVGNEYRPDDAVDIQKNGTDYYLVNSGIGEWTKYTAKFEAAGKYTFKMRIRTTTDTERIGLDLDYVSQISGFSLPNTNGEWQLVTIKDLAVVKGIHQAKLLWETGNVDIDYLKFESPLTITPYLQINGGSWKQASSASVSKGATIKFGPQPNDDNGWNWTGPNGFTSNSREITVAFNQAGTFTYSATYNGESGAGALDFIVTVDGVTGVGGAEQLNDVSIYPNPVNGEVTVDFNGKVITDARLMVYSLTGQKLSEQKIGNNASSINISMHNYAKGTYLIQIVGKDVSFNKKVVVQ